MYGTLDPSPPVFLSPCCPSNIPLPPPSPFPPPRALCLPPMPPPAPPLRTLVLERWSTTRPGVPTTMCGRLPSAIAWAIMSMPPTNTTAFTPMPEPSASTCSAIWAAWRKAV